MHLVAASGCDCVKRVNKKKGPLFLRAILNAGLCLDYSPGAPLGLMDPGICPNRLARAARRAVRLAFMR